MLTPRYFFADDFRQFHDYFLSQPHIRKTFQKGSFLWKPGQPHNRIHYIISGVEMHYADHENGKRKIISFHGPGTVFPGYHQNDYKIELSLITAALSEMEVLEFTISQFQSMFQSNTRLTTCRHWQNCAHLKHFNIFRYHYIITASVSSASNDTLAVFFSNHSIIG